jgi:ERCC4-type nuclease
MILDSREHGLNALLPDATSLTLDVGDIWIGEEKGLIIERKSVADLEASILDGRYREQRSRCMAFATEKGRSLVYIIEGVLKGTRMATSALQKHLTRLSIRYHIPVFRTASLQETADLCTVLEDQWMTDKTTFEQPATMTYVETRGSSRQANSDDPRIFAASVLACCRGISMSMANDLLTALGSLDAVFAASKESLAAVKVGKQTFGKVKAERLHGLLHSAMASSAAATASPTNHPEPISDSGVSGAPAPVVKTVHRASAGKKAASLPVVPLFE